MSFQGYLDSIEAKTGKNAADFRAWGMERGFSDQSGLKPGVKATPIVEALASEFGLGRGHAMAIVALLKGQKKEGDA